MSSYMTLIRIGISCNTSILSMAGWGEGSFWEEEESNICLGLHHFPEVLSLLAMEHVVDRHILHFKCRYI